MEGLSLFLVVACMKLYYLPVKNHNRILLFRNEVVGFVGHQLCSRLAAPLEVGCNEYNMSRIGL